MRLGVVMAVSLVAGLVLMLGFEGPVTRTLGVLALFTFIVSGVFLVADPAALARDEDAGGVRDGAGRGA